MSLRIHFRGGPLAGRTWDFDDSVERIVIGRDPDRCQVVLPAEMTQVGREHLALTRSLGRYRLVVNRHDPVLLDGKPALDETELPEVAWLRLGREGPELVARTIGATTVPPTAWHEEPPPSDLPHVVKETARRTRGNRVLGALVLAGLVLLGGGGLYLLLRTGRRVTEVSEEQVRVRGILDRREEALDRLAAEYRQTTFAFRERLAEVDDALDRLTPDLSSLREAVAGLGPRMEGVEERVQVLTPRLKEVLSRAWPSVYVVLIRDARGTLHTLATAWVVESGLLATNAHVAEFHSQLGAPALAGGTMLVRSPGAEPRDHVVTGVRIHPGYAAFLRLWETYRPTGLSPQGQLHSIRPAGAACDVALLEVSDRDALAAPLVLAPDAVLERLDAGDVVGMVGYPSEEMSLGGVNLARPIPTIQIAHVTAVTNYFLAAADPDEALLVQHALPVTGGASGSPILDEAGEVVAVLSAGNIEVNPLGERAPSAVLVNFAQRSDLVRELLEGRAAAAQGPRSARWEEGIRTLTSLQAAAERGALGFLERYLPVVEQDVGVAPELLEEWTGAVLVPIAGRPWAALEDREVALPGAGQYVFFGWGVLGQDVNLLVLHETDDGVIYGREDSSDWYSAVRITVDAAVTRRVRVIAPRDAEYRLRVYRFAPAGP